MGKTRIALEKYNAALNLDLSGSINSKRGIRDIYNNIAELFQSTGDLNKAEEYYDNSLAISELFGDVREYIIGLINIGSLRLMNGDSEASLISFNKAKTIIDSEFPFFQEHVLQVMVYIAKNYHQNGEVQKAKSIFDEIILKIASDDYQYYPALNEIGTIYYEMGQLDEALSVIERSLELTFAEDDCEGQIDAYNLLGCIYWNKNDKDMAKRNFECALELAGEDFLYLRVSVLGNMATQYSLSETVDVTTFNETRILFEETISLAKNVTVDQVPGLLNNFGKLLLRYGKYEDAFSILNESLSVLETTDNIFDLILCRLNLCSYYIQLNNISEALEEERKAYQLAKETESSFYIAQCLKWRGKAIIENGFVRDGKDLLENALHIASKVNHSALIGEISNIMNEVDEIS